GRGDALPAAAVGKGRRSCAGCARLDVHAAQRHDHQPLANAQVRHQGGRACRGDPQAMSKLSGKTYWLVGASQGLGRALAAQLSALGVRLVLSARDSAALQALADKLPFDARTLPMDVTDDASVAAAAAALPAI